MVAKVDIDDGTLQQLQQAGELRIEDTHGVPLVLMTIDARQRLTRAVYDDSEFTEAELKAHGAEALADPDGWGHSDMDVYDTMKGIDPNANAGS